MVAGARASGSQASPASFPGHLLQVLPSPGEKLQLSGVEVFLTHICPKNSSPFFLWSCGFSGKRCLRRHLAYSPCNARAMTALPSAGSPGSPTTSPPSSHSLCCSAAPVLCVSHPPALLLFSQVCHVVCKQVLELCTLSHGLLEGFGSCKGLASKTKGATGNQA